MGTYKTRNPDGTWTLHTYTDFGEVPSDAAEVITNSLLESIEGLNYVSRTINNLSANQAAGTTAVLPANSKRKAFSIVPLADGNLYYTGTAATDGVYYKLYAGVPKVLTGADCPKGAFYVSGQPANGKLRMGEA